VKRWADRAAKDDPELLDFDSKRVGDVVCERYPFLRRPAQAVAEAAGLSGLSHIGRPGTLLTHRLMAIEAAALTEAMMVLRSRGILALPMHDGLLVPVSGKGHVGSALDSAYSCFAKVRIRWKVTPAPGVAPCVTLDGRWRGLEGGR
jgi:hypothetical protein